MISEYERDLSNLSYTNKDFGTIYPELLDLATKLSYKWNPVESDESDPGVVLLKVAALMADKANYNTDKNVLELFPLSVTQEQNARQIFNQCGYRMRYYRAATTTVQMAMISEPSLNDAQYSALNANLTDPDARAIRLSEPEYTRKYSIPRFTTVSDIDNSIVYTLTDSITVPSNELRVSSRAIEGTPVKYQINGSYRITSANLDYKNRLYISDMDVAENGIFIHQSNGEDFADGYGAWERVDNLATQPIARRCYEFDVAEDGKSLYLEFPTDADTLFGDGIYITYIRTRGRDGNITAKRLTQFFTDVSSTCTIDSNSTPQIVSLTSENVFVTNDLAALSGTNPETIDEAYENYQKVKNTFHTLVSIKDYTDFLSTEYDGKALASNGFVCDRTNDIQSSVTVLSSDGVNSASRTYVTDEMTPFDIKVYGLQYAFDASTDTGYEQSFTFFTDRDMRLFSNAAFDLKCIQHNLVGIKEDKPIMFFNLYPIKVKIVPQNKLETLQKAEIEAKVAKALLEATNAKEMKFGQELDYNYIYDVIQNADLRIKAVILDDFQYNTFAMFQSSSDKKIKFVRIDSDAPQDSSFGELQQKFREDIFAKSVLYGTTPLYYKNTPYSYSPKQEDTQVIDGVDSISTTLHLQASKVGGGDTLQSSALQENENIVFTAPNLEKEDNYSSYVKFLHNIPDVVRSGSDYVLDSSDQGPEFISFFWKKEDGDDKPYTIRAYKAGSTNIDIFSPSMRLDPMRNDTYFLEIDKIYRVPLVTLIDHVNGLILPNAGNRYERQVRSDEVVPFPSYYKQEGTTWTRITDNISFELNHCIASLVNGTSLYRSTTDPNTTFERAPVNPVLTGSNTIETKKMIQLTITDQTNKMYWITNDVVDNKYVLFKENETSRVLNNGEYLIYTNNTETQLFMLSTGTKIERSGRDNLGTWAVSSSVGYIDIISGGIEPINGNWFDFSGYSDITVTATEMEYYQYGPQHDFQFEYVGEGTAPESLMMEGTVTTDNSGTVLNTLADYNITITSYDDKGSPSGTVSLTPKNSDKIAWKAESILNISASPSRPQKFESSRHSVSYFNSSSDPGTILVAYNSNPAKTSYVLTDRDIMYVGGQKVDVKNYLSVKKDDSAKPLNMIAYSERANLEAAEGNPQIKYNGFSTLVKFFGKEIEESIDISTSIPVDRSYLLSIYADEAITLSISVNSPFVIESLNGFEDIVSSRKRYYRISRSAAGSDPITIELTATDIPENGVNVYIDPMYDVIVNNPQWTGYSLTDSEFEGKITDLTSKYDIESIFNYQYEPSEDVLIADPLVSSSFFDQNHVFNRFTIGKWDLEDKDDKSSIVVTDKVR